MKDGFIGVGLFNGNIEIWDNKNIKVRGWKGHRDIVKVLVFTLDGRLVSISWDGFVKKWDVETGTEETDPLERWSRNVGDSLLVASELADGRLVVGGDDVRVLDGTTGHEIMTCRGHTGWVNAVVSLGVLHAGEKGFHPAFASGSSDGTIRVWANELVRVVKVGESIFSLSLSPCCHFVAAGCYDGSVKLYRLPDWDQVWSVKAHQIAVSSVSWNPDGRFLASGSLDCAVKILSADTGATLRTLRGHNDWVNSVLFSQNGTKVLSGSDDKTVRIWRVCSQDDTIASMLYHVARYQGEFKFFADLRLKLMY